MGIALEAQELTIDSNFQVRESVALDLGIGAFFFFLFAYAVTNDHIYSWSSPAQEKALSRSIYITLIPAVLYTLKGIVNRTSITINKNGFYYYGKLVTNWSNFIEAWLDQEDITLSTQDNFILRIRDCKDGESGYFARRIPLTNTQNKSEEEVLAAIKFFSNPPAN